MARGRIAIAIAIVARGIQQAECRKGKNWETRIAAKRGMQMQGRGRVHVMREVWVATSNGAPKIGLGTGV